MHLSILSGILAFVLWCVTDTSLKPDHARNSEGRITFWGVLSIVLVQIVLWTLAGLFAVWIIPHLPRFLLVGWRLPFTLFVLTFSQWFALLMILQYFWTIMRVARTAAIRSFSRDEAAMAAFGAPWHFMETERKVRIDRQQLSKGGQP